MTAKRPTLEDKETKHAAYAVHADAFTGWVTSMGVNPSPVHATWIALAIEESADAYEAAIYLQRFFEWPMTIEGVRILDKIYNARASVLAELTEKWVVSNAVRIKGAVGQSCTFSVGDAKITGTIAAIIHREARLIVEVRQSATKTTNMSVLAEDVVKIVDGLKASKPTAPTTGGTPAAVREAVAA